MAYSYKLEVFNERDIVRTGRSLGQGTYGVVVLVKLKNENAALKVFKENCLADAYRELNIMARLHHDNILRVIGIVNYADDDHVDIRKDPNVLLEYMSQGALTSYLKANTITENEKTVMCIHILRGVTYLHDIKIIHRDLAARNVLVNELKIAKIADFGFSVQIDSMQWGKKLKYTKNERLHIPLRWSPKEGVQGLLTDSEEGCVYSTSTDVWAFGVTMWEILTNCKTPYHSQSSLDKIILQLITAGQNPSTFLQPRCSKKLREIMQRCFSVDLEKRPTPSEVRVELESLLPRQTEPMGSRMSMLLELNEDIKCLELLEGNESINKQNIVKGRRKMAKSITFGVKQPIHQFVGRKSEIEELERLFNEKQTTCVIISGLAGQGKSELCRKFIHTIINNISLPPPVISWLSGESIKELTSCLEYLAKSLSINLYDPAGNQLNVQKLIHEIGKHFQNKFQNSRWLAVLDGMDNKNPACLEIVTTLIEHQAFVLITSKRKDIFPGEASQLILETLSITDAKLLVTNALDNSLDEDATLLCNKLENHPFSLQKAVSYIYEQRQTNTNYGITDYLKEFSETKMMPEITTIDGNDIRKGFEYGDMDSFLATKYLGKDDSMGSFQPTLYLGRGSFGWVFKIERKNKSKGYRNSFALKMLPLDTDSNETTDSGYEKQLRGFYTTKNCKHENVMSCFSVIIQDISISGFEKLYNLIGEVDLHHRDEFNYYRRIAEKNALSVTCIKMELCGTTLRQWLRQIIKGVPVSEAMRFRICCEIMEGLKYLHKHKVIHRDLKPENIFFSSNTSLPIKLGDFGLSRRMTTESSYSKNVGTRAYTAPEILRSDPYNESTDVYAFGVIMWEVIDNSREFDCLNNLNLVLHSEQHVVLHRRPEFVCFISDINKLTSRDPRQRLEYFKQLGMQYRLIPQAWVSLKQAISTFHQIKDCNKMPENFMEILSNSIGCVGRVEAIRLRKSLLHNKALYHYDQYRRKFTKNWTLLDLQNCLQKLSVDTNDPLSTLPKHTHNHFVKVSEFSQRVVEEGPGFQNRLVKKRWKETFGKKLIIQDYSNFLAVENVKSPSSIVKKEAAFLSALPVLLQNLKMSNPDCILPEYIIDITKVQDPCVSTLNFISRLDLTVGLLSTVDDILGYETFRILGQFSTSVPLVFPSIFQSRRCNFLVAAPWLQSITTKRETKCKQVIENHLFRSPFKLVLAVRVGSTKPNGKSTILNSVLSTEFMFTSCLEPGASHRTPTCLEGTVELVWLTVETCKPVLWKMLENVLDDNSEELFLLANLHGDCTLAKLEEVITMLSTFTTAYLVFTFANDNNSASLDVFPACKSDAFAQRVSNLQKTPPKLINISAMGYDTQLSVGLKIAEACSLGSPILDVQLPQHKNGQVVVVNPIESAQSKQLISIIQEKGISKFKKQLSEDKVIQNPASNSSNSDDCFNWADIGCNPTAAALLELLMDILQLPLQERQKALIHLDRELTIISGIESKEIRIKLFELKKQRSKPYSSLTPAQRKNCKELLRLESEILKQSTELRNSNFGIEHIFREMGKAFEGVLNKPTPPKYHIVQMVRNLAEVVAKGQVVELVDGDAGNLSGQWLNAVLQEVSNLTPRMKVFVVSILGLQSSGKSTLLNSLFGCRFTVSGGRCTKGIYLRILYLSEDLKKSTDYDAIILVDTEGMCAAEKMMDHTADQRDREIATFAMLISDLTLVNLMGETMKEMTDILQIVVVTMARLEKVEVSPDVLLIQHCSAVDKNLLQSATTEFCNAIREAIQITYKQHTALGIINSNCLKTLCERVENNQLLHFFHPYRNGATVNAPPSKEYFHDVKDLYQKILRIMATSTRKTLLKEWHGLSNSYWNALKKEDFSLRFKNIQAIHDFIERGTRIADVNGTIVEALGNHRKDIKIKIREHILLNGRQKQLEELKSYLIQMAQEMLEKTLHVCAWTDFGERSTKKSDIRCQCRLAVNKHTDIRKHVQGTIVEEDVNKTIATHIQKSRHSTAVQLESYLEEQIQRYGTLIVIDHFIYNSTQRHPNFKEYTNQDKWKTLTQVQKEASELTTDEKNNSKVGEFLAMIYKNILDAYSTTPLVGEDWKRLLKNSSVPNTLRSEGAIKQTKWFFHHQYVPLEQKQVIIVEKVIQSLVNKYVSNLNHDTLLSIVKTRMDVAILLNLNHDTLLSIVKTRIAVAMVLDTLSNEWGQFHEIFKWKVHLYAVQYFQERYEYVHEKRSAMSSPTALLALLPMRVKSCLKYGYTIEGEGTILANTILYAVLQKSKKEAEQNAKDRILKGPWLSSVDNVRLTFFDSLVEEIKRNHYDTALAYFQAPKQTITEWYKSEVDAENISEIQNEAATIYNDEVTRLKNEFENFTKLKSSSIWESCILYLAQVDGIPYYPVHDFRRSNPNDHEKFNKAFFSAFKKKANDEFNKLIFRRCSESTTVMDRLGCTDFCYWCGALCWGHASHDANKDVTRKHHTCHQPQGLAGVWDEESGELLPYSCENLDADTTKLAKSSEKHNSGLTWRQIKLSKHFENWIFINHSVDDFNDVMGWLFLKLNSRIAQQSKARPCNDTEMTNFGYSELNDRIDGILAAIRRRLLQSNPSESFL